MRRCRRRTWPPCARALGHTTCSISPTDWVLAKDAGARNRVRFEMLEGMANHQRRALADHAENMLLYAPACREEDFINAISYLIRRLDENTGPDNFLRHAFHISEGDPEWERMEKLFQESVHRIEGLPSRPESATGPPSTTQATQARRRLARVCQ